MIKILFVVPGFDVGGTSTALINLLSQLDKERYAPFVYAINNYGSLKGTIKKIAPIVGHENQDHNREDCKIRELFFKSLKGVYKILQALGLDLSGVVLKTIARSLEKDNYDCVISFQEGTATRLVSFFEHTRKCAWVRSMYSRYSIVNKVNNEIDIYKRIDTIICVSKASFKDFIEYNPEVENKTCYIYDLLNSERIIKCAKEACVIDIDQSLFNIVSIGRLDKVKRFSLIPRLAHMLKERKYAFKWYIIGGAVNAEDKEGKTIRNAIKQYGVEDVVVMLGEKPNPYPYLKASNLLVSLSESETFNYTLTEAKILGVPVVTVDYACAYESISDNREGMIVSIDNIGNAIERMMGDSSFYNSIKDNLSSYKYDGGIVIDKIYQQVLKVEMTHE